MAALLGEDAEAIRMTERIPYPCTVEAAREWISLRRQPGETAFSAFVQNDVLIGMIGFATEGELGGLGYWFGRAYWGQGYATEAVGAILAYARTRHIRQMLAEVFEDNIASARVLEKNGFERKSTVNREFVPTRQGPQTMIQFVVDLT